MRVILGILKGPGPGWSKEAAIVRAPGWFFGEARGLEKEAGLGCACAGHWLSRFL
jgi:hypothetical protein